MRIRRPWIPWTPIKLPKSVRHSKFTLFSGDFKFSLCIACELVHLALGSSAGTENDTCVSARIKIFMMTIKLFLITKLTRRSTFLTTSILKTQNCCDCTKFPLKFVTYPFLAVENFLAFSISPLRYNQFNTQTANVIDFVFIKIISLGWTSCDCIQATSLSIHSRLKP